MEGGLLLHVVVQQSPAIRRSSRLRSGGERCQAELTVEVRRGQAELAVEVRRGTLPSGSWRRRGGEGSGRQLT